MNVDQYSSRRNIRPGFPTAEEIKKTTEPWIKHEQAETVANKAPNPGKPQYF
jgi:hypothetical protein